MSLAKILAQRRTVSDSRRAQVLRISTGTISGTSHQSTPPLKLFRYPHGPWWRMPCQLKYANAMIAHDKGTLTVAVGEVRNGKTPNKLAISMNSATLPTTGT